MNVLIVDDEQHVREAIRLLIDWEQLGISHIYEAENGVEAAEQIVHKQPEIVITDMRMPHRDGVELLAWLQEQKQACKTIVISGYDDFTLVRSSMKYGGQDYILKPIDPEQLTEALLKAKQSWENEDRARRLSQKNDMEMNQIKPIYWDKLFSTLISASSSSAVVPEALTEQFALGDVEYCQAVVLSTLSMERSVTQKFRNNRDLLFFALTNVCNEILKEHNRGFAFRYWNSDDEIVILLWNKLEEWEEILCSINNGLRATINSRFDYGIGTRQPFPKGLSLSYQTARTAIRQRSILTPNNWLHHYDPKVKAGLNTISMNAYEERFRNSVWGRREKDIQAAVHSWIEEVQKLPSISLEQMELWRYEYENLLTRWYNERMNGQEHSQSWQPLSMSAANLLDEEGCLSFALWRQELLDSLVQVSSALGPDRGKDHTIMQDIAKYMEQHYDREVTLQHISERFFLSREYISRRFKQELGENVFDYLGRIRIDKAKLLLQNPHLKMTQIAEMVGYDDEKYFSKVFKKFAGMSPNQYRKQA